LLNRPPPLLSLSFGEGGVREAAMDKQHILREIQRTAKTNGGVPFGEARFATETGITRRDWYGTY
jgi:hypothetical protein